MEKDYTKTLTAILIISVALFVFLLTRWHWSRPLHPESDLCDSVIVEVKGDVSKPGIYTLKGKTASAGVAAAMADCSREIPAAITSQRLVSGQSLEIFHQEKEIAIKFGRMPGAALLACGLKLDLNSASLDDLLLIPHMRHEIAVSIVERRREKAWEQLDDLSEIDGVGPKTAKKLQEYLEISGGTQR